MKIYNVVMESNDGFEFLVNVVPCMDFETAKAVMNEEVDTLLSESYEDYDEENEDYVVERENDRFFIKKKNQDYYDDIHIIEQEVLTKA